jgi:hypothetical protein
MRGGEYRIDVTHPLHGAASVRVVLGAESVNVGEIRLEGVSR